MAIFKTTHNILTEPWNDELFNPNWMDSDTVILPPNPKWDYSRELKIEDIDIWEQIYYQGGGLGLYAAWCPYAEFYMITHHLFKYNENSIETFYGPLASDKAYNRAIQLGMPVFKNKIWVEDEEMWLYKK
jgi:hypothetical protein